MGRQKKIDKVRAVISGAPTCPACGSSQVYCKRCGILVCRKCGRDHRRQGSGWVLVDDVMTEQHGA